MGRKAIKTETKQLALHEAGYRCGNPACRTPLTLEVHHLDYVSESGKDTPDNLLPLCPHCHALHHQSHIPTDSLKTWKSVLLSLNEGFDHQAVDILLALDELNEIAISGDGMLHIPGLLVSHLVEVKVRVIGSARTFGVDSFKLALTDKGKRFIASWKAGDQVAAITSGSLSSNSVQPSR